MYKRGRYWNGVCIRETPCVLTLITLCRRGIARRPQTVPPKPFRHVLRPLVPPRAAACRGDPLPAGFLLAAARLPPAPLTSSRRRRFARATGGSVPLAG